MIQFYYLDGEGREIGSVMAHSFSDVHAWLCLQGIRYASVTKYRPKVRKGKPRRSVKRSTRHFELAF